ncbi:hypothetical protein [Microbacterium suaedae]|uniref:hypothetical protein n=1 Tax=Microbacterium suaedae TaxID=2067813 RepID=UPI000DA2536F|nr:hypothetical protein [Microbacterium suaedae]
MSAAHRLRTPPWLPGIAPRVGLALAASAGGLLNDVALWQVTSVLCGLLAAVVPSARTGYLVIGLVVMGLLQQDPSVGRTCAAVLVVHMIHVLTSVSLVVPFRARITLRAARPGAIRFLGVQLIAQAAAILAVAIPTGPGLAWFAPVGAVALGVVAVVFLSRLREGAG